MTLQIMARFGKTARRASARIEWPLPRRFQGGFTLLEMLVTLTVLGFLIAMVAPRLAGTTSLGLRTVTRTNMTRLVSVITAEYQRTGKYPSGMVNIVSVDSATSEYHKPMLSDQDPDTGPEVLSLKMDDRHRFRLHHLNQAEADELRAMGVLHVFNYNSPYDRDVMPGSPNMEPVTAGIAVLMTGGGDVDNNGSIDTAEIDLTEAGRAHPYELFRMAFGLGVETSLVKNGVIHGPSTCPESGMDPVNYEWKWYSLLLPRLQATAKRLENDDPIAGGNDGLVTVYAVSGNTVSAALSGVYRREVTTYPAQNPAFFAVMDSEGEVFPTLDMEGWGLDFDGNGDVD